MKINSIGLLPNFDKGDLTRIVEILEGSLPESDFSSEGENRSTEDFRQGLSHLLETKPANIYLLDSARSALYLAYQSIAQAASVDKTAEVLMPAFTCVVAVNPVLWAGLKPVFVEISDVDFNTPVEALLAKVTQRTKVIFCQHTFGAQIDVTTLLQELGKMGRSDVFVIEDLAHNLGDSYNGVDSDTVIPVSNTSTNNVTNINTGAKVGNGKKVGTRAHMAVATFGLEKVISTLRGGALVVNPGLLSGDQLASIDQSYAKLPELGEEILTRLLKNVKFWQKVLPKYYWGIGPLTYGKIMSYVGHKQGILGVAIDSAEYQGGKPSYIPAKMPTKLTAIGNLQLGKYRELRDARRKLAEVYSIGISNTGFAGSPEQQFIAKVLEKGTEHSFLRYPLLLKSLEQRALLLSRAKKLGFVLGDWYKTPLYTKREYLDVFGYQAEDFPVSEDVMSRIVNLPTSIQTEAEDAQKLVNLIANI